MTAAALLLGLLVGFVAGVLLRSWSEPTPPTVGSGSRTETNRPKSPPTILDAYRPSGAAIAEQLYLRGLEHGTGEKVTAENYEAVVDSAGEDLQRGAELIAAIAGHAYVDGAGQLRAALSRHSGIDDGALDDALAVALARKAREDGMRKEHPDDADADPDDADPADA